MAYQGNLSMASWILTQEQFEHGNMTNTVCDTGNFIVQKRKDEETCVKDSQIERDYTEKAMALKGSKT